MIIELQSKGIDVFLELFEDFERNWNYELVVEYLLIYRLIWGNEIKQVKCLNICLCNYKMIFIYKKNI